MKKVPLTILQALSHPLLFKGLLDAPSWRPWLVFLRALFGLPMSDAELAVYRHHTGRSEAPTRPFREAALVVGRRGGKSRLLAVIATYLATVPDYKPHTAPGETPVVAIIAADRRQGRVIFGYIAGLLRAVPALAELIEDELAETIRLSNGVAIEIHTGSIGSPRGRTFIAVLADEIAFWSSGDVANPDREVINAVRPGLATLPNSILLMASSPYARRGVLFDTFARYYGKDDAPVLVWRGTTLEMNSALDPRIVEEAYEADPESASAEYGAEFRSDITAFIGRDAIDAVMMEGVLELPPATGVPYQAFVDPSGGSTDSMTLAIGHLDHEGVAVLDAFRERKPPFSPEDVVDEFCTLLRAYNITRVQGDAYAGEWPRERFSTRGIAYELSGRNKNAIYQDFLPALNGRRIRLLGSRVIAAQFCNLERRTTRGGRDSIDHAPGAHDDVANAVAGVLTVVLGDLRPTLISRDALLDERGAPVPLPAIADGVFASMATDAIGGQVGVCYWAMMAYSEPNAIPLLLLDFWTGPNSGEITSMISRRTAELAEQIKCRGGRWGVLTGAHLEREFPGLVANLPALAMAAAKQASEGKLKKSTVAAERELSAPMGAALSFRAGDDLSSPLTISALLAIAAVLLERRDLAA